MTNRARVVFDTNVLVSALLLPDSTSFRAYISAERDCDLVTSAEMLSELNRVLARPKFDRYVDQGTRLRFLARVQSRANAIVPDPDVRIARDPKDDVVLATAKAASADFLVTGDEDLLVIASFAGVSIVTPSAFLARHAREAR